MMQHDMIFLPNTWQLMNPIGFEFPPSFTATEESIEFPSSPDLSSIFSYENMSNPMVYDQLQSPASPFDGFDLEMEGIESFLSDDSERSFLSEELWSPDESIKSSDTIHQTPLVQPPLVVPHDGIGIDNVVPDDGIVIDNQVAISHLLKAYGEAIEKEQNELADVILRCLAEKANPAGEALERLAYSLSQEIQNPDYYLTRESAKNLDSAFKAFYQILPYGRFAHFAANSAILESVPADAETICIVDFDIGEGLQWPPVIEVALQKQKQLKLITLNWGEGDLNDTKRRLCDYARRCGVNMKVEQVGLEELVSELKKLMKRGGARREWLVFNCMIGLPHMGRSRSMRLAKEFITIAKGFLSHHHSRGILTLGNGDSSNNLKNHSGFGSFFETNVMVYQAVLESMEANFPKELLQARMAMEALFVAPNASMEAWKGKWEEDCCSSGFVVNGLEGVRVSEEMVMECRAIARESESMFEVRVDGGKEMVLNWRGTPIVRVSAWTSGV